jgi:hypothetical protein
MDFGTHGLWVLKHPLWILGIIKEFPQTLCILSLRVFFLSFFLFFLVLGFELRAYTLSHSTSPFL